MNFIIENVFLQKQEKSCNELLCTCQPASPQSIPDLVSTVFSLTHPQTLQPMLSLFQITMLLRHNSRTVQFTYLKHATQWFLVYSQNCATITTIDFRIFRHPKKKPHTLQLSPSDPAAPYPLAQSNHSSALPVRNLPVTDISYAGNYTICNFL